MFLRDLFALNEKNVKEERARAHAAFVVEVFSSEFVLPLEWGSEFHKTDFSSLEKQTIGKDALKTAFLALQTS